MSKFDETLMFIAEIERAVTPDAVCQQLLKVSSQYGLGNMVAGTMPRPKDTLTDVKQHNMFLMDWPVEWLTRYYQRKYDVVDPILSRVRTDLNSFTWDQAPVGPEVSRKAQIMMGEASEFGLKAGFAVPLITLEGSMALVSLGGERMEMPPYVKGMLSLISTYALGRAIQLRNSRVGAVYRPLTNREIEAMRWAADGKTEWEISVIMSISEHTAAKHLNNARGKLGAVNRVQAIANAIRSGIIR